MGLLDINGLSHTVCIHPKTSLWECLNGTVGHKWTVHTTHTVYIYPKTSLWECLNGIVGHKWTVHTTHTVCVGVIEQSINGLSIHTHFKHSHRHVFGSVYDSVCGMDSPFMSNNPFKHSHRDVFGCIPDSVCGMDSPSMWECLNGIVGHKWTVHTHTLSVYTQKHLCGSA